ncbi:restriction endonuclease subunit S [Streptomyces sp. NPDC059491]|uniref:restriction endonuclease subunit S n=1 Tax=Streptomyces sp. NPDC059491 TaxID=3346850 RepID=UPI003679AD49
MSADVIDTGFLPLERLAEVSGGLALGGGAPGGSVELPYLRVANVQDGYIDTEEVKTVRVAVSAIERFRLMRGDVLLTEGGDLDKLGRGAVWDGRLDPCLHQNHIFKVRCNRAKLVPEFLALYMASGEGKSYFLRVAKQTTNLASISSSQLKSMPVPVHPLAEQRRIVAIIDAVLAQERAIEASIAKLRSVRQGALLTSMIAIQSEGSPAGWARVPLKDVVPAAEYGISEALDRDSRGIPVLRMNNLQDGRPELSEMRYSPVPVTGRLELRTGDVLFNRTNSIDHIGKSCIWRDELPKATFASYLVRINPDRSRLIPEYLVEWLMHPVIRQRVRSISTIAVQQVNVNPTRLRELEIDLPVDLEEQRRIVDFLHICDGQIHDEQDELAKLRALKRGLVGDLLSGKG